jgi:hypothetical protein
MPRTTLCTADHDMVRDHAPPADALLVAHRQTNYVERIVLAVAAGDMSRLVAPHASAPASLPPAIEGGHASIGGPKSASSAPSGAACKSSKSAATATVKWAAASELLASNGKDGSAASSGSGSAEFGSGVEGAKGAIATGPKRMYRLAAGGSSSSSKGDSRKAAPKAGVVVSAGARRTAPAALNKKA